MNLGLTGRTVCIFSLPGFLFNVYVVGLLEIEAFVLMGTTEGVFTDFESTMIHVAHEEEVSASTV
jgi:hypothetical protein